MTLIMTGKDIANDIKRQLSVRSAEMAAKSSDPCLLTIRFGSNPDDEAYESSIVRAAEKVGIRCENMHLPKECTQPQIEEAVFSANSNPEYDAILMFRPFPRGIDETAICNSISPAKDVDGSSAASLAGVFMGENVGFAPATAEACMKLLDYYDIDAEGKHVVIVGRSLVIGKPVGMLLLNRNATVTYCHSRTADLCSITRSADIVVCAVGKAKFFDSAYFGKSQIVLDVGMNLDADGHLCGDVDFDDVEEHVAAITPVPGGIGSITTSVLLGHVVEAACANRAS